MSLSSRRVVSITVLALLTLAPGAQAVVYENLTDQVGRGFGSTWNRYAWSMVEFQGKEYVGTWNVQMDYVGLGQAILDGRINLQDLLAGGTDPLSLTGLLSSRGGEIWCHDGNRQWTQVHKAPNTEMGFRQMVVHKNTLYAASADYQGGSRVLTSSNGTDWTPLTGGPMDNPDNTSIRTMLSHNGLLYVGTENSSTGAELWTYNNVNDTWKKKRVFANDTAIGELAFHDERIYVGTWDFRDSYRLYCSSKDYKTWKNVTPEFDGAEKLHNFGVMQLREFNGQFYLGTVNYFEGFTLLRSSYPNDPDSWEVITTNGMGDPDNAYTWSGAVWNGKFYIGTFNDGLRGGLFSPLPIPLDGRGKLLCSEDGLNWAPVVDDGFGSPFTYGIRTMLVNDENELICGTASNLLLVDLLNDPALAGIDLGALQQSLTSLLGPQVAAQLLAWFSNPGNRDWIGCEVYAISNVPEPAALLLVLVGTIPLLLRRRH